MKIFFHFLISCLFQITITNLNQSICFDLITCPSFHKYGPSYYFTSTANPSQPNPSQPISTTSSHDASTSSQSLAICSQSLYTHDPPTSHVRQLSLTTSSQLWSFLQSSSQLNLSSSYSPLPSSAPISFSSPNSSSSNVINFSPPRHQHMVTRSHNNIFCPKSLSDGMMH